MFLNEAGNLLLNQRASNMPDRDVRFLNPLRVRRGNVQQQIGKRRKLPAGLSRQCHHKCSASTCRFRPANDIRARSTRRERNNDIFPVNQRLNLPRKDPLEPIVISSRSQHGWIRRQRQRRKPGPLSSQPNHKLRRKMQRVRRTASITEQHELASSAQSSARFFRKRSDPFDKFRRKRPFNLCAFVELSSYFVGRGGHGSR
jgi:hypothetical protein